MILGAKIVIILETKEYFTYNLVVWRIFIWSFGGFMFGYLALPGLTFWQMQVLYFRSTISGFPGNRLWFNRYLNPFPHNHLRTTISGFVSFP